MVTETFSNSGTFSWTVPANCRQIKCVCWGGGGNGGTKGTYFPGGGGGGGACAWSIIDVVPGDVYTITNLGGVTRFKLGTTTLVQAAKGSNASVTSGGAGGTIAASIGQYKYAGGAGASASGYGGGGGEAGCTTHPGNPGSVPNGGSSLDDGGDGGRGANELGEGQVGHAPGGGSGGSTTTTAINGASGAVVLTYTIGNNNAGFFALAGM